MKRVRNESAMKRCSNCRRPKGEHNRVQGLVLCRKRLAHLDPSTPISAIVYAHPVTVTELLVLGDTVVELGERERPQIDCLNDACGHPACACHDHCVMIRCPRESLLEANRMISEGGPVV